MKISLNTVRALAFFACFIAPSVDAQSTVSISAEDTRARIESIAHCLAPPVVVSGEQPTCTTLENRMAELHVPGVSIAVVHGGKLEWARGYGVATVGGPSVSPSTLFEAGSISKPVAALAALHLVQDGSLLLDSDVNARLTTWKIPESDVAPNAIVTLRELLTHTAGFTVHGFPGYAASDSVPTLVQVLNGEKPANTRPIRLESIPGSKWNYSGGGYTVMQQLLVDTAGKPFPVLVHDTVLAPIGMTSSTYEQPLPGNLRPNAATPYKIDGSVVPGGAHTYPEMAAAGLWTTPSDLAQYIIENQQSLQGKSNRVLSQGLTRQMFMSGIGNWGLGMQIGGSQTNPYFTHGGVDVGFESLFVAYENEGEGAVVMTNAQGGLRIANEVIRSIAVAYRWPDFQPSLRVEVRVDPSVLSRYVGAYRMPSGAIIVISLEGGQLNEKLGNQMAFPIFPQSETMFFLKVVDAQIEFPKEDGSASADHLILHQNGKDYTSTRLDQTEAKQNEPAR